MLNGVYLYDVAVVIRNLVGKIDVLPKINMIIAKNAEKS